MSSIPIDEIIIPEDRIRREFDQDGLEELADSIWRLGLIHPITLHNDARTLSCGERRIRAHNILLDGDFVNSRNTDPSDYVKRFIDSKEIPYSTLGELSPEQRIEAELEENVRRRDLSWQEQARAQAKLHKLRQEQHGTKDHTRGEGWSVSDTAREISGKEEPSGSLRADITDSLKLEEFLDDPFVAAAPTKKEALKVIEDLEKAKRRQEKAQSWDPTRADMKCIHGSCYDPAVYEALIKDGVEGFDCIIADPPYGRSMHKHGFANPHKYDDTREIFKEFVDKFPRLAFQISRPQAHLYIFHDLRDFNSLYVEVEVGGWKVWPWPIIWDKGNVGSYGDAKHGPRHVYDAILYANKGEKECTMMQRDVINITQDTSLPHPAGKPIELYAELLKRSTEPGDYVLDPMCGGGTIFPAASRLKLHATGIEKDEKYYHMSIEMAMEGK